MNENFRDHPSEDALERYLLNMSPEEEIESIETHTLACEPCVEKMETLEAQIAATRLAFQNLEARQTAKRPVGIFKGWKSWITIPRMSFAATAAVAAAGAFFLLSIPRDVTIIAYRGTETAIVSEGRPLHVHLNAVDLIPGPVTVELADSKGSILWRGPSVIRHDTVAVTLPRITHSGAHLVRLYSTPQPGSASVLLREFALNAQWQL
jgi:hypothetical protein